MIVVLIVNNLFFYSGGQSVSCKASLAALRLCGYFCDIVMMLLSENKYDDDDDTRNSSQWRHMVKYVHWKVKFKRSKFIKSQL